MLAVARGRPRVRLAAAAVEAIAASRVQVDELAESDRPVYGVSTGFGALATRHIEPALRAQLQRSLIRSHAASSGVEVEAEVVRAMMLLRLSTLASGVRACDRRRRPRTRRCSTPGSRPIVREHGSLGCSGDLAPLAHAALALMGEGDVRDAEGIRRDAAEALAAAGIMPVELAAKEGLALINGTDGMLGMLVLACADLRRLVTTADLAAALSVEGLLATDRVFAADLQALRPHPGQAEVRRATSGGCSTGRRSSRPTGPTTARSSRTRTRCGAPRRSPAPHATRSRMPRPSPSASWPA